MILHFFCCVILNFVKVYKQVIKKTISNYIEKSLISTCAYSCLHSFCFRRGPPKCDARRRDDGGEGDKQLQTKLPASYPKSSDADSAVVDLNISSVSNTCEFKERSEYLTEYRHVCLL